MKKKSWSEAIRETFWGSTVPGFFLIVIIGIVLALLQRYF